MQLANVWALRTVLQIVGERAEYTDESTAKERMEIF